MWKSKNAPCGHCMTRPNRWQKGDGALYKEYRRMRRQSGESTGGGSSTTYSISRGSFNGSDDGGMPTPASPALGPTASPYLPPDSMGTFHVPPRPSTAR